MENRDVRIRAASPEDAKALLGIYGPYVERTAITFEYQVPSEEEFARRIEKTLKKYPYLAAEAGGEVLGYAYAGAFHDRAAYDWAVETSIYVDQNKKGMGIGRMLHDALEDVLKRQGILNMNACIAYPEKEDEYLTKNSAEFHEHLGYRMVGEFRKCGYKFGCWYHMVWMEKWIGDHHENPERPRTFAQVWGERGTLLSMKSNFILETKRLYLRQMDQGDFQALCRILQDDEVMYAYEGAFDEREVQEWLDRQIARYKAWGFGLWAVILKETDEMIGQCGLTMQPWKEREVLEIGYLFSRSYWHKGYALEAAGACKRYGFEVLGADEICSIIRDTNIPSRNVAVKNGMTVRDHWVKHYRSADMPHDRYVIERGEWEREVHKAVREADDRKRRMI